MKIHSRMLILVGILMTATATTVETAYGQVVLEEIVVTSQRREASLQEVPLAVTAISPEQMELKQIRNIRDLQFQVPNINIANNTGTASAARIFLRGVGEDESRASADPAVGIYVDGIYIGRQTGGLFDLVDLERIEVLRGPQGTLYGRNSNGGAIKLVSQKPGDENDFDIKLGTGSDGRFESRLTGNWAISASTAIRATVLQKKRDGFQTINPNGELANLAGTELGDIDSLGGRIALRHDFGDNWSLDLAIDYTDDDSEPTPGSAVPGSDGDNNLFTTEPQPTVTCSNFVANVLPQFLQQGCKTDFSSEVQNGGLSLSIEGDVGDYTLSFLTGYRELEDDLNTRIGFPFFQKTNQDQFSQEVTLASNYSGAFNFLTGVYYFSEDIQLDSTFVFPFELDVETDSIAAFFQSTYDFTDATTLTTGIRITDETKDFNGAQIDAATGLPQPMLERSQSRDFQNTTFTLAVDHQFTESVMGYASYASGFKGGGWSPDCFLPGEPCFRPVNEENLDSFEIGVRSDLLNDRVRLNATYFFNVYDNLQLGATVPGLGFTRINVDETNISGLEVEFTFKATDKLDINATLGLLDANYESITQQQAEGLTADGVPCPGGIATIECALGLELKNAPDYKGTIGALYTTDLSSGELTMGVDVSFEDDQFSANTNSPPHLLHKVGTLVNARVGFRTLDDKWNLTLWGRNLTDEEYSRVGSTQDNAVYPSAPLTWGVDVAYSFF